MDKVCLTNVEAVFCTTSIRKILQQYDMAQDTIEEEKNKSGLYSWDRT